MFGLDAFGVLAFGGQGAYPPPTVSVVGPVTPVLSSPEMVVEWTTSHPDGFTQTGWRLRVLKASDNALLFDTGQRDGTDTSYALDLVERGLPVDENLVLEVRASVGWAGTDLTGLGARTVAVEIGVPAVTLTEPTGTVTTPQTGVSWTYTDSRGNPQAGYRVRLLSDVGAQLYDTGWQTGQATTFQLPYRLGEASYEVRVQAQSTVGAYSPEVSGTFDVDLADDTAVTALNPDVGTLYEVAIDGQGFMLFDDRREQGNYAWQRAVRLLDPPRLSTGDTPFNQSFDRYSFGGVSEWQGGAGQTSYQRETSDAAAFAVSYGVDPFDRGHLTLLHDTSLEKSSTYGVGSRVVGTSLVTPTGTNTLVRQTTVGSTGTTITLPFTLGGSIQGLATDGVKWYAACGADGVYAGQGLAAQFSDVGARAVAWHANRLCVAYPSSGNAADPANAFNTLSPTGELESSPSARLTLPPDWSIVSITGASGFVWFAASNGNRSAIYVWRAGSADAPYLAAEVPWGHTVRSVFAYQGQVMVRAAEETAAGGRVHLYRGVASGDGTLSLFIVTSFDVDDVALLAGGWGADERLVFTAGPGVDQADLVAIDLSTGGWASWLAAPAGTTGAVTSIDTWQGLTVFSVSGAGAYMERDTFVTSGWVQTSVWDGGGSNLQKAWAETTVRTRPLPPGTGVRVRYSTDEGGVFIGNMRHADPGGSVSTFGLSVSSRALALELTLESDGAASPDVSVVDVKYYPSGPAEEIIQLPIACHDTVAGLNEHRLPEQNGRPGSGAERARWLRSLVQKRVVLVQDVDWRYSKVAEWFEVIGVAEDKVSLMQPRRGQQEVGKVVTVQLRKAG